MEPALKMDLSTVSPLLTEPVFKQAVQQAFRKKYTGKDVPKIISHTVNYASSKGDGYLGIIYRISVQLEGDCSVCIIGKGLPISLTRRKSFHLTTFFAKEVQFYTEIVPAFREFEKKQRGSNFVESFLAIPDCYHAIADGENDFLLLEDLNESGYVMLDRNKSLTVEQIQAMFKMLARFHAFSMAMQNKDYETFGKISKPIFEAMLQDDRRSWIEKYLIKTSEIICSAVVEDLKGTDYLNKFKKFIDPKDLFNNMKSLLENNEHVVISHGDAWIANFMFNSKCEVKAIDFQLTRLCSPMCDVSTVIFACTTAEERAEVGGVPGILRIYHDEVLDIVKALGGSRSATIGVTPYTLDELWRQRGAFGFAASIELLVLSMTETEDVQDADEIPEGTDIHVEDLLQGLEVKGEANKKRICDLIKLAVDDGLLG